MRAFIALAVPEEIKRKIENIQRQIPEFKGKLTEKENLHLTLKFLGEISPALFDNVKSRLSAIKFQKLSLSINEIGIFEFQNNPNIVWLRVSGAEELQKKIDLGLSDLFKPEERFMSHLTIARIKYVSNVKRFNEEIKKIIVPNISFKSGSFELMESNLTKQGPSYQILEHYIAREK